MNRDYYAPIRRRADGSIYIVRNHHLKNLKDFLGFTAAILLLILLFTAILMFALVNPTNVKAQRSENAVQVGGIGSTECPMDAHLHSALSKCELTTNQLTRRLIY